MFCGVNEVIVIGRDPTKAGVRQRVVWVDRQRFLVRLTRTSVIERRANSAASA